MRNSYHDIKTEVLRRIRNNTWAPGALMPGEIELAKEFGCARATVNRAMRELVDEGILERKRKAGTRVRSSPARRAQFAIPIIREEITGTGASYRYVLVERQIMTAPDWLRGQVGLDRDGQVLHIRCMHYAGNAPYQYEDRWINLAAVPAAADFDFEDTGPNEWLVSEVPFTDGELVFSATTAASDVAEFLNTTQGAAIFTAERTTWLNGTNVTYARMFFCGDYKMTTRF